jgi:hypothetical protein
MLALAVLTLLVGAVSASPTGLGRPLLVDSSLQNLARRASADPSCPSGFLCNQQSCPSGTICPNGETCISFEGTLACVPTGTSWCALNPTTFEGVGCAGGTCWYVSTISPALLSHAPPEVEFLFLAHIKKCYPLTHFFLSCQPWELLRQGCRVL